MFYHQLVDAGYRVIGSDLLGYGLSNTPENAKGYDITKLPGDTAGMLGRLGVKRLC